MELVNFAEFSIMHKQLKLKKMAIFRYLLQNFRNSDICGILMLVAKFVA